MLGKHHLLPIFVLIAGSIHGDLFLTGYRLTADDVSYHLFAMNGLSDSWQFIKGAAYGQGRIVHFSDLVTSLLGSYYADEYLFRLFYVLLFFSNFILVAFYFDKLTGSNARWFILLVLISFHPLDYFHLSPTSYPLKISFPIFLILSSRIALLNLRQESHGAFVQRENLWLLLCLIAMMFSEYAFSFALSLICIEYANRSLKKNQNIHEHANDLLHFYRDHFLLKDMLIVAVFITLYMGFRITFPSSYDGNQLPEKLDALLFLKTLAGHIYGSTTLSSFHRYNTYYHDYISGINERQWFTVAAIFIATLTSSILALKALLNEKTATHGNLKYFAASAMALFSAILVTIPVAITSKYQGWCININSCLFLDSSLSYLGFGIFLASILVFLGNYFCGRHLTKILFTASISALIAIAASLSQVNNLRMESDMRQYISGWERAKRMACLPNELLNELRPSLTRIVDPARRIGFHSDIDINSYWITYINDRKRDIDCSKANFHMSELYPRIEIGKKIPLGDSSEALIYLSRGWGLPEPWGTWSDGKAAAVIIPLDVTPQGILIETRAFVMPNYPTQDVVIKVNDTELFSQQLSNPERNIIQIAFSDELKAIISKSGLIRVDFKLENAVSPKELDLGQDTRRLAIGLFSVTVL